MKKILFLLLAFSCLTLSSGAQRRLRVAVVLGGGGAKGAAEVGVLKVLEKADIPVDMVVGTSIGSIVGGLYAIGYSPDSIDRLFRSQEWLDLLSDREERHAGRLFSRTDSALYVLGIPFYLHSADKDGRALGWVRGNRILDLLGSLTKGHEQADFDRLGKRFRCVAVDGRKGEEVVFRDGNLGVAMRASMSIPGVFKPVERDGQVLFDGGVLNNLPVDVAKAMGADVIIAVDLTQKKRKLKKKWTGRTFKKRLAGILYWSKIRPDLEKYHANVAAADVYINPRLKGFSAASFSNAAISEMIRIGEEAASEKWGELCALLKKIYRGKR